MLKIRDYTIALYKKKCADYALERGIIITQIQSLNLAWMKMETLLLV